MPDVTNVTNSVHARVVIVGAGFAGASLLRYLPPHLRRSGETLLIDRAEDFAYIPLAHEVATGRLHPKAVSSAIEPLCEGRADFLKAEVEDVSPANRTLSTSAGDISYDYLVLASGSSASKPPESLAPYFSLFWTLDDALRLRDALAGTWRAAVEPWSQESRSDSDGATTVAIVGGGTTGVELAAEIGALFQELSRKSGLSRKPSRTPRVVLYEAEDRLMGRLDPYFHEVSLPSLKRLGVEVHLNSHIEGATEDSIETSGGVVPAATKIWTAGLEVSGPATHLPGERGPNGRIPVTEHLTHREHSEIYVLGDAGYYTDPRLGPVPTTASVAVQQGPYAARDLGRRTSPTSSRRPAFDYFARGDIVSLGPDDAVGLPLGTKARGPAAHALYRSVLLYYLRGRSQRTLALSDWAMRSVGRLGGFEV